MTFSHSLSLSSLVSRPILLLEKFRFLKKLKKFDLDTLKESTMGGSASIVEKSFHEFKGVDIHGKEMDFAQFKGKVVLLVNTASY